MFLLVILISSGSLLVGFCNHYLSTRVFSIANLTRIFYLGSRLIGTDLAKDLFVCDLLEIAANLGYL